MVSILCFGDSITYGLGEKPCLGWVGRLKEYVEKKDGFNHVHNLGISGKLISDLNKRFSAECEAFLSSKKNIVIIALGNNDTRWIGMPEDNKPQTILIDFKGELKLLIDKVKSLSAEVLFVGLTPVDESRTMPFIRTAFENKRVKEFNDLIEKECLENNFLFVDIYNDFIKENYVEYIDDGLHPNSKGYKRMYELIKDFLIRSNLLD